MTTEPKFAYLVVMDRSGLHGGRTGQAGGGQVIERRNCLRCGTPMTPDVIANDPPRPYWECPACHEAEPA